MNRVNKILRSEEYKNCLNIITEKERERIYCKHTIEHFIDVARIMQLMNLERGLLIDKEIIYATALLHDIGRSKSDEEHDIQGALIAQRILKQCDFDESEIKIIMAAIAAHRKKHEDTLNQLLYLADKMSRTCFYCKAKKSCKWKKKSEDLLL